ncbi:MAG: extensin family protein [Polyangiaceae bacterium]
MAGPGYQWPPAVTYADGPEPGIPPVPPEAIPSATAAPAVFQPPPPPARFPTPMALPMPRVESQVPAGGSECIAKLGALGVNFERLDSRKGVETPVVVKGDLGGVRYVAGAGLPLELDCRMAVTLQEVGPLLRALGVSDLRFSGAYVYRMSRVGRLSYHAYGLAIDVHALRDAAGWHEVKTDFARGLPDGCAPSAPALNRVACELKRTGRFKEMLTPDYNADHHDHLHWGVAPLPQPDAPAPAAGQAALSLKRP